MRYFIKLFVYTGCIYIGFCGAVLACGVNEIDVLGDGTQCETAKFSITTTELVADTTFAFYMSAKGTFYVDWGDGTVDTIVRNDTDKTLYNHTYLTAGVKTIRFSGLATGYNTNDTTAAISFYQSTDNSASKITSVSGNLSAIFPYMSGNAVDGAQPRFYATFYSATNLTTIPDTLFANYTTGATRMFHNTFNRCSGLTSIPAGLFSVFTTATYEMFRYTFIYCSSLTSVPEDLFSGITVGAEYLFRGTFEGCTGLTSIPSGLFQRIKKPGGNYTFFQTFYGCTGLTSIPSGLFAGIQSARAHMFYGTFEACTNLSGYIPPSTFAGLIANGHPTAGSMWHRTFAETQVAISCPAGTTQYITGYEGNDTTNYTKWNGKVSCVDENLVCGSGEYLPAHWFKCETCPENNYCVGGTYPYSETNSNGTTQCPTGLFAPSGMWEAAQCGRILHVGDGFVYLRSTKKTSPSLHLDLDHDGVADYFGNMTTLDVPMSHGTSRKLKVRMNGIVYSIYDDSVDLGAQ